MKHWAFVLLAWAGVAWGLSPEEERQYLEGAGMGYAKAAELNRFPGPMHVLELADPLGLSIEQITTTEKLMKLHKAEARAIGAKLVEAERALEALFRGGKVSHDELSRAVARTAALQGEYRLSHLETHRRMRGLLSDEQVRRYDALRGYPGEPSRHPTPRH
jgi:hypothetical protein